MISHRRLKRSLSVTWVRTGSSHCGSPKTALASAKAARRWHQGELSRLHRPALGNSIAKAPSGDRWIHEVKFDGYRVQIHIANDGVKVFTRRGHDWANRFKKIAADAWHINAKSAIIDGEVIAPASDGVSDFSVLQNELRGKSDKLVLHAFDLLNLNGYDMRKAPLFERKAALQTLIARSDILLSESFETDGATMLKQACSMGLEGVVSKVRDARYNSGRTNDWVKVTCRQRETLPIAGFAMKESKFDGIYLARQKGKELIYARKIDHGFDSASAKDLQARFKPLIRKNAALLPEDRVSRILGRAIAACRNRIPGEVCGGQTFLCCSAA
jgi:bifunctional non-homologous end joining protein LigD